MKFISKLQKLLTPTGYYFTISALMFCWTLTLPCATFTISWNSGTPELRDIPWYTNCSYSMYFASSNINLDSLPLQLSSKFSTLISRSNPFVNWDEEKSERAQHISWSHIVSETQLRIKSETPTLQELHNSKTLIRLGIRIRRVTVLNRWGMPLQLLGEP